MTDEERRRRHDAEMVQIYADIAESRALTAKLQAETVKLATENRWHPLFIGGTLVAAGGALMGALVGALFLVVRYAG